MIRVLLFSFILNSGPVERKIIYDSESYLIIEKYFLNESEEVLHEKMIYYKYGNDKVFIFESGNWTEVSFEIYSKSQWKAHDFDSNVEPISFDKSGEYFFVKLSNLENTYLESLKIELLTEEYSSFPQFLFFKYEENSRIELFLVWN